MTGVPEIARRFINGVWVTGVAEDAGGGSQPFTPVPITKVDSPFTAAATQLVIVTDAPDGDNITVHLPAAPAIGAQVGFALVANEGWPIVVDTTDATTINGAASITVLNPYTLLVFTFDGNEWVYDQGNKPGPILLGPVDDAVADQTLTLVVKSPDAIGGAYPFAIQNDSAALLAFFDFIAGGTQGQGTLGAFQLDPSGSAEMRGNGSVNVFKPAGDTDPILDAREASDASVIFSVTRLGGVIFPSADPHVANAWWDNGGTLTRSSG